MKFASWNVRGLKKSPRQKELEQFISSNNIDFMGFLETKVKVSNALGILKKINKKWQWLFNYDYHYIGRVWVGWDPSVWEVSLHSKYVQFITCNARLIEKDLNVIITFVYAFNDAIDRVPLGNLIATAWSMHCVGSPVAQFNARLKHTKLLLRKFNRDHGNIQSNVQLAPANLEVFQASIGSTIDNVTLIEEKDLISKLNLALTQEESLLLQKARVKWLHLGDNNNSYFYQKCKLLGAPAHNDPIDLSSVGCKEVSEEQARLFVAPVTDVINFETIKKMRKNKAPGRDGVNVEFFLAAWHITGASFCAAVRYFLIMLCYPRE
ncbi:uncharacterized protein LOC141705769 [Apium graveolens]|uniref:uncharacterized protein LOC141705769 n=1 Tax=Apium graveolens TaxID=4045 RepID=UPI003D7A9043